MAATGSNHKERHLAQSPEDFDPRFRGLRNLHMPFWAAAVVLVAAILMLVCPAVSLSAGSTLGAAAAESAPVVPILFPMEQRVSWTDTFGAPRSGGRTHAGNDLLVPKMTPLLAVVDGRLDWLNLTGKLSTYNSLPYYNILLRGDDGNDYFYIHLNNDTPGTDDGKGGVQYAYAPGVTNGTRVKAGDVIGYVGDSGNAEDTAPHLHFEIHLGGYVSAGTGQTRTPSAIDPYPSLKAAMTLSEWIDAGRPPLTTTTTHPGATTTTTVKPPNTTTTTKPPVSTTTTTVAPPTTTTTVPVIPGFDDVKPSDWFYEDFAVAFDSGIVTPDADHRFRPYSSVSRALFAAYLVRTMAPGSLSAVAATSRRDGDTTTTTVARPPDGQVFKDVPPGYWAYKEIQTAARLGLVKGTGDGSTFSPQALVTRAQMATMMCRALGTDLNEDWAGGAAAAYLIFDDVPAGYWAQGSILMVDYLGLMCGDGNDCFRPAENTTRAQAITVMARLLRLLEGGSGS